MPYEHCFSVHKRGGEKVLRKLGIQWKNHFTVELYRKIKCIMEIRVPVELKKAYS